MPVIFLYIYLLLNLTLSLTFIVYFDQALLFSGICDVVYAVVQLIPIYNYISGGCGSVYHRRKKVISNYFHRM